MLRQYLLILIRAFLLSGCLLSADNLHAQGTKEMEELKEIINDSVFHAATDSILHMADSMVQSVVVDTTSVAIGKKAPKKDWATWQPNPKRALWLALVIPGGGQIYNRKYWKLPIVYGGFVGCIYAISWNNQMYHDYAQAYIDLMDDDPRTQSYNEFLHLGVTITDSNKSTYQELFRKRKDRYRRWRDLSVFALVAVYALSVIDAYVDASLSEFDISKDLSLRIAPTVLNDQSSFSSRNPLKSSAVGVGCSLKF